MVPISYFIIYLFFYSFYLNFQDNQNSFDGQQKCLCRISYGVCVYPQNDGVKSAQFEW